MSERAMLEAQEREWARGDKRQCCSRCSLIANLSPVSRLCWLCVAEEKVERETSIATCEGIWW